MTNEELHNKIHETNLIAVRTEGKIDNILNLFAVHAANDTKEFGRFDRKLDEIESRQWKSLWLGVGAVLEGLVIWFTGSKH